MDYLSWSRRVQLRDIPLIVKHCRTVRPSAPSFNSMSLFIFFIKTESDTKFKFSLSLPVFRSAFRSTLPVT